MYLYSPSPLQGISLKHHIICCSTVSLVVLWRRREGDGSGGDGVMGLGMVIAVGSSAGSRLH